MKLVYICSPLRGDIERNIRKARGYCRFATKTGGVIPVAPHIYFSQFLDEDIPEERELGMQMGLKILEQCQELWCFGTRISDGMKAEIKIAKQLGIPVLYYTDRCEKLELASART